MNKLIHIKLILIIIIITATIIAITSTNIVTIWISLELNIFSFIPLLLNTSTTNETEGTIAYFLSQTLGSIIFLLSRTILITFHWYQELSTFILIFAIILKLGIVPCHYWYPITIELVRWLNCLLLSTWQKIAPLFIILFIIIPKWKSNLIIVISSLNALGGGIIGLRQSSLKKIIAYSSITHIGWTIRAITINMPCISLMYFIIYSIITIPLFLTINKTNCLIISDLWSKPILRQVFKITLSILILSMSGLPPLTGFLPKLIIINILIRYSIIAIILIVIGSLINLFFYLNICLSIIISAQENKAQSTNNISLSLILAISLIGIIIIFL